MLLAKIVTMMNCVSVHFLLSTCHFFREALSDIQFGSQLNVRAV